MDHRDEPWTSPHSTSSAKGRPTIPSLHFTSPDASHEIRGRRSLTRGMVITACRYEILTDTSPRLLPPFGRWRYLRAPQGFLSSGDGYNRRFDAILAGFDRKERIVDDTIFHDEDLEEHWWRTIDFLSTVGQAGVVLNPNKFQFASREVDFAGFRITDARIDPLPKFYSAIEDFPTPTSTTDIRSWFGLVNQVANYAQMRQHMEPFRPFLSPRHPFR